MNIGVVLLAYSLCWFFFKQKTAYEMRISDWSSDVCSSDLIFRPPVRRPPAPWGTAPAIHAAPRVSPPGESQARSLAPIPSFIAPPVLSGRFAGRLDGNPGGRFFICCPAPAVRSDEHTSDLQSLMSTPYDVSRLQQKNYKH